MSTFRGGASLSTFLTFVFWSWSCAFFGFVAVCGDSGMTKICCYGNGSHSVKRGKRDRIHTVKSKMCCTLNMSW